MTWTLECRLPGQLDQTCVNIRARRRYSPLSSTWSHFLQALDRNTMALSLFLCLPTFKILIQLRRGVHLSAALKRGRRVLLLSLAEHQETSMVPPHQRCRDPSKSSTSHSFQVLASSHQTRDLPILGLLLEMRYSLRVKQPQYRPWRAPLAASIMKATAGNTLQPSIYLRNRRLLAPRLQPPTPRLLREKKIYHRMCDLNIAR